MVNIIGMLNYSTIKVECTDEVWDTCVKVNGVGGLDIDVRRGTKERHQSLTDAVTEHIDHEDTGDTITNDNGSQNKEHENQVAGHIRGTPLSRSTSKRGRRAKNMEAYVETINTMALSIRQMAQAVEQKSEPDNARMKMANWSHLPQDLIWAIANRLGAVEDFAAFSAVCTSWRTAVPKECWKPCVPRFPWLLITESVKRKNTRWFWNLERNKKYDIKLPLLNEAKHCWGSSNGWVFTQGNLDDMTVLINPLNGVQITFPTFHSYIIKALVFDTPSSVSHNNNIVVIIFYKDYDSLAYARPGFKEWIVLQDHCQREHYEYGRFTDMIFYKDQFFRIGVDMFLVLCEIDNMCPKVKDFAPPPVEELFPCNCTYCEMVIDFAHLIVSDGDLLMILNKRGAGQFKRVNEIYKFNLHDKRWTKLEDLGGRTLLLGNSYSTSVVVKDGVPCKGNCIYCAMGYFMVWENCRIDIFGMTDKSKEKHTITSALGTSFSAETWVLPSLK
ncbi:hypothetical protein LguiA_026200 [Lonicera macranthoides]